MQPGTLPSEHLDILQHHLRVLPQHAKPLAALAPVCRPQVGGLQGGGGGGGSS